MNAQEMLEKAYQILLGRFDIEVNELNDVEAKRIETVLGDKGLMLHLMQRELDNKGVTMIGMYEGKKLIDFELVHYLALEYKNTFSKKLLELIKEDIKNEGKVEEGE